MRRNSKILSTCLLVAGLSFSACKDRPPNTRVDLPPPPRTESPDDGMADAPAPTLSLSASPATIDRGEQTSLKWSSENGTSLVIDNGIGNVRPAGEIVVSPSRSTTYSATVTGRGGEAKASTRVTVLEPRTDPVGSTAEREFQELLRNGTIKMVHFPYDKAQLTAEARTTLQENALIFRKFPEIRFVIEGHCDERGSEEYNLALGDRRAIAVRDYLVQLGVDTGRMEPVSYGEEQPLDTRKNEAAFARNRRAQFKLN